MNFAQSSESFKNVRNSSENFRKSSGSLLSIVVYIIGRILYVHLWIRILSSRIGLAGSISHSFAALTSENSS